MSELSSYQVTRESIEKELRSTTDTLRREQLENQLERVDQAIRNIKYNNPTPQRQACSKCGGYH